MAVTFGQLRRLTSHGINTGRWACQRRLAHGPLNPRQLEREKISQRTKVGLERARATGKVLGRPKFSDGDLAKLRTALDGGKSWHAVSIATRIPYSTVKKHARTLGYKPRQHVPSTTEKAHMVKADPSAFTSRAIAIRKRGVPLIATGVA